MSTDSPSLPVGFEPLAPFVREWGGLDEVGVVKKRLSSSIEDLEAFYEAGRPLFPAILAYMKARPVGSLSANESTLFSLALALVEVSFTFEVYFGNPPWHIEDVSNIIREVRVEMPA